MKIINQKCSKWFSFIKCSLSLLVFAPSLYANATQTTNNNTNYVLNKYYNSSCQKFRGTWSGFFVDTGDMFDTSGPWPINASFSEVNNVLIVNFDNSNVPDYLSDAIFGIYKMSCENGTLNLNKNFKTNGTGYFISKNVIFFDIPYQNSMNQTQFLVFLNHQINQEP